MAYLEWCSCLPVWRACWLARSLETSLRPPNGQRQLLAGGCQADVSIKLGPQLS